MLGAAIFYKSTPKMPKNSQLKRGSTTTVSPVSKKRRIGSDEGPGKKVVRSIKSENGLEPRRTSARLGSSRLQSAVKQEKVAIKEEVKEEEEDEEWVLPSNKMSDDNEDSDDSDGEMSAYEKKRLQNIQENAKFFASLGISKTKNTLSEYASSKGKSTITKGLKREKKEKEPLPRRPLSLRIRRMDPEGVALPDAPAPIYADDAPSYVRKPSGPFDMEPTNLGSDDGGENSASRLFKSVTNMSQSPKSPKKEPSLPDLAAFTKTLQRMRLAPERIAKVTKDRVLSVAVHPSASKIITCAGDKWGRVGVWDVESAEGDDGVYLFEPHSRPVSCLQFAPKSPAKLFSCSYDGTLRCGDFEKGIFDEIHTTDVDDDVFLNHFDFLSPDGMKLLVAQNQQKGYVQVVDARVRSHTSSLGFWLHNRYVKTVHIHPTKPQYFVTASNDSSVALWDLRSLKEHGHCKSISSVPHGKSVSAAYFSPITGSKAVTTSYDDRVRILDVTESGNMEVEKAIRHDNHTGRWLTTFRAGWHPRREDVIVVGSMERPRRIHLFDDQGRLIHSLMDEALGSVCSVNAFHPTRDLIVGANSSGRLHVFM
ncbi:WD repeat-containing protein 76-like isoform X2 [Acanthaster planci]|uniref:WD repeat-containing protein 76 n=1 Tax=Acanthaster planci TaxID=133434 RepID=A0A8B7Z3I8_ACAPL|nr:WD repeat-containing protein 76-like isoform X2 [Acanthaster planci]